MRQLDASRFGEMSGKRGTSGPRSARCFIRLRIDMADWRL
jgi:hypothetical protein